MKARTEGFGSQRALTAQQRRAGGGWSIVSTTRNCALNAAVRV